MVLEKQIIPFLQWLPNSLAFFLLVAAGICLLALIGGFLMASIRNGPVEATKIVFQVIGSAWTDFRQTSFRRIFAMARLAFKESIRRYVLIVFVVFMILLSFGAWYLDVNSENPAALYISVVLKATNFLTVLLAIFLSAFSLPADIKNKTIYTIVTKPVRPWEIVFGRILGFGAILTLILAGMCLFSFVFVKRGLNHRHAVDVASVQTDESGRVTGMTTRNRNHRHEFYVATIVDDEGNTSYEGATDARQGHVHRVTMTDPDDYNSIAIGPPTGNLEARVPIYGGLRFLNRKGELAEKGINVGKEWTYRGYIEGSTLSAGIWHFQGLKPREFPTGLPIEMAVRVFRTYKGEIERGIAGTWQLVNGDFRVQQAAKSSDPEAKKGFDPDTAVATTRQPFIAQEFTPASVLVPRTVECEMLDGSIREVDLFESLVSDGHLELKIQCEERAQYFGMASADVYVRASDRFFWMNFIKGYFTVWLQLMVVTAFGVMFSTFLTGSVAMLATLGCMVMGYFSSTIFQVATGELEGGGPVEAVIRVFTQKNLMVDLGIGKVGDFLVKAFDAVSLFFMRALSSMMPNFRDYAESGGINTARFLAYGFDIPPNLMGQHILISLAYILVVSSAGYFFLKTKEIAA
jgi:hypothetical protein